MKERKVLLLVMLWMIVPKLSFADCGNIIAIQIGKPGPGYESTPNPEEQESPGLPDFIVEKVWLENTLGEEIYDYPIWQEVKMKARVKNIGEGGIQDNDDIELRFYLSNGYKEDSHSEWIRVGKDNTKGRSLDPEETHTETEGLKLWKQDGLQIGDTKNIVACIDRTRDQNNGIGQYAEEHESNNCSTEAVFTVNNVPKPEPPKANFITQNLKLTHNRTWLYGGDLYGLEVDIKNNGPGNSPTGIRTSYDIKGPGTGNNWQRVADDGSDKNELTSGKIQHEYITDGYGARIPDASGRYTARSCADYQNAVTEESESDNCTEYQFDVRSRPKANLVITWIGADNVKRKKRGHGKFWVCNHGDSRANGFRSHYSIKGPGTGYSWVYWDDDGTDSLNPDQCSYEYMKKGRKIPNKKKGWYEMRVCVDVYGQVSESNEGDNCQITSFYAR